MSRTEPAALALPQCLGYILKCECVEYNFDHRIGFLYSKPSELYWSTYPRSLRQLLESQRPLPSKLNRILFAQRLASCISGLHSNSWIHGNLSSSSIIFFPEEGRPISYNDFFLSEFGFLRPVIAGFSDEMLTPPSFEEIVFLHPAIRDKFDYDQSQRPYWRSSDIYAFGVMLIEVAFWKTIDQVLSISEEGNWRRLLKNENLASEHRLAYVKSLMGEDYAKIVRDCLTVQPSVDEGNDRLLLGMFLTISKHLSKMSEALQS
jgi:serine/threonine protein kinase